MSHYSAIETKIKDQECLLKALADLGWDASRVEVGNGLHLYGYHGDQRPETAEVVVRRKHIGSASNDLGFKRQADGTYAAIVSDWDQNNGVNWTQRGPKLLQRYGYHTAVKAVQPYLQKGYRMQEEKQADGRIRIRLTGGAR